MTELPRFLKRELCSVDAGSLRFLDVLRWATPFGTALKLYVGRDSEFEILKTRKDLPVQLHEYVRVSANLIVHGTAPDGEGEVLLNLGADKITLNTALPEPELFNDLNVMLGLRHLESSDQVVDWLRHHALHHGLTGCVLFDRAPPDDRADLAAALTAALDALPMIEQLVLVTAPLPLGKDGHPAFGDAAVAPRSKDRRFTPDPWRAQLAEPVLFDILKSRFLSRAGAVIALDPCDMLRAPEDGIAAFEAVRQSHSGMMPVQGQMIFPWRVRKGQAAVFADHICRAEPAVPAPMRFAITPKRAGSAAVWMPNTVAGMVGIADEIIAYDRAASIHVPGAEVATLVNKDVLTRDTKLFEQAQKLFGHKPIQPPERKPKPARMITAPPSGRTVIVTCMKNEGPFILEWLAYHRMIGVDDFLIYTNDCDDGTEHLLNLLQAQGLVQRRDNPFKSTGAKPQHAALEAAQSEPIVKNAGWVISMDVDEFINVHVGGNRLPDLYDAVGDASLISMTWRLFGNSDIDAYQDQPVIENFTRCAPQLIRRPHQAWGFKTLFRNQGLFRQFGVHRPRGFLGGQAKWVNGSGKEMPERLFKTGWRSQMDTWGYDLVTLNHYSLRSAESFLVKRHRGRVNHVARDQGEAYWFRMNNNDEQDLSIQRHVHGLKAAMAELMAIPEIAAAHQSSVKAHRARIAELRQNSEFAALFARITSARFKKLSRMHRHFGMNVFLQGPSSVPDRVFEPDLPADFFFNTAPPDGEAAD